MYLTGNKVFEDISDQIFTHSHLSVKATSQNVQFQFFFLISACKKQMIKQAQVYSWPPGRGNHISVCIHMYKNDV